MASGVGLACDEGMGQTHEGDPFPCREEPSNSLRLESAGIPERCVQVDARNATTDKLQTVHNERYIEKVKMSSSTDVRMWTSDHESPLYVKRGPYETAHLAAGCVIEAATQVAEGKLEAGACAVRPPGLYAGANTRKGSSIFNHVAVAVKIVKELGVPKVLVMDWDVHHGNGTQKVFWDDPQVLYISFHRYDDGEFFPKGNEGNFDQVGIGKGSGNNINVPLPHGAFGDADYLAFFEHIVMPVARDFNPDMIFISAGFNSASGDPVGGCNVTPDGYARMTQQVRNELQKYWPVLGKEVDLRAEQQVMHPVPPAPAPNLSTEWPLLQFDIDEGLCVRAPMDERELKKQFPLQALLEEGNETLFLVDFLLVPEF